MLILGVCVLSGSALSPGETIADFDFGKPGKTWNVHEKGSFDGTLPEGLTPDFPGWTKSVAKSELIKEGDLSFTRFTVTEFDNTVAFRSPLNLDKNAIYKFEVISRSPSSIGLVLRQGLAPYASYYNADVKAGLDDFLKSTLYANLSGMVGHEDFKDIALFFRLKPGVTDIRSLRVTKVTQEELQISIKRPAKGMVNFLRNSRFPLGLQSGWNFSGLEAGGATSDEASPGPSGAPSLKVVMDSQETSSRLFSEPFQTADPYKQNHISFSCKVKGDLTAVATDNFGRASLDMHVLAKMKLPESEDWKSIRLDFTPDPTARSFTLAFAGKGTLWLDSLRAWAGDGDAAYVSQGECELALALPESDASIARIQFSDEAPALDYCATGNFQGATLKSKVVGIHGKEMPLPDQKLGLSPVGKLVGGDKLPLEKGAIDFSSILGDKPLGQFRIEVWIERDGKRISPFNEMVVTRIHRPLHWNEDAPNSPFGCHFLASPIIIPTMKAAGVNWVRLHDAGTEYIGWYHLEPEKGKWVFRDASIQRYRDGKIKIFGTLQTAPLWASSYKDSGKKEFNGYFDRYWTVEDWDGWANYVKTVCTRYKGVIDGYYIWNEPDPSNGVLFLHDGYLEGEHRYILTKTDGAKNQARLCEVASKVAKEIDPKIRISGPNIYTRGVASKFNQALIDDGAYNNCDFADYHNYVQMGSGFPGDMIEQKYTDILGPLIAANFKKPIHMSEGTSAYDGPKYAGMYKHSVPWDQDDAEIIPFADDLCRFVVGTLALGVERINLYTVGGPGFLGPEGGGCFTMLNADGYPHPALAAFSNMAWQLEDRKFMKRVKVGENVWAYIFEGRNGTVAVISGYRNGKYTVPNSSALEICDLFGNPSQGEYKGALLYVKSELPLDRLESVLAGTL